MYVSPKPLISLDTDFVASIIREVLTVEIPNMAGLFIPSDVKRGMNWAEMKKI